MDLIETLWNVKLKVEVTNTEENPDLIETLWNVKRSTVFADDAPDADLIETLWNVKCRFSGYFPSAHPGFNSDIVECKGAVQKFHNRFFTWI